MAIKQKLIIDQSKSSNNQIIVRDETGLYSLSNPTGYGGNNGNPYTDIIKYVFVVTNLFTGQKYTQIQSDDLSNINEFHNPSIDRIVNKEDVTLDASNFGLTNFSDAPYKIDMYVVFNYIYEGDGYAGTEIVVNTSGAQTVFNNYNSIYSLNVYNLKNIEDDVLILDETISSEFHDFFVSLKVSSQIIISDELNDCLNKQIADFISNCNCNLNNSNINYISELQVIVWGLNRSINKGDYLQASEYLRFAKEICKALNCGC